MTLSNIVFTRKEYNLIAENRGIKESQKMSIEELLNTLSRDDSKRKVISNNKKLSKLNLKKIAEKQNISKNEICIAENLQVNQ